MNNSSTSHKHKNIAILSEFKRGISRLEALAELVAFTLMFFFVWKESYRGIGGAYFYNEGKYMLLLMYAVLLLVLMVMGEALQFGHRKLSETIVSQWICILAGNVVVYLEICLIGRHILAVAPMLLLTGAEFVLSFVLCYVFTSIYHRLYVPKDMLLIYGTEKALDLKFKMDERIDKYRITSILDYEVGFDAIVAEIAQHDAVIINDVPAEIRNDIMKYCYSQSVRTYVVPKISDIIQRGGEDITLFDTPLYLVRGRGLSAAQRLAKRLMDLAICLVIALPVLLVMAIVALAIKLEDGGPVFYRQERITAGGKPFWILKFRSMIVNAEASGHAQLATGKDPRITKVGNIIRPLRLDELPQLINIFKGDMSWVGPRPERQEYIDEFSAKIPEFTLRTKVKGGLTGYAQIYGRYNTSPYDKLRLDLMYIENYSFLLDIKLIFMTLQILLKKESTEGMDVAEDRARKRKELLEGELEHEH